MNALTRNVYIALGGNLGDVPASFRAARSGIEALSDTRVVASSKLYRTPPLGPAGQADYWNAVIHVRTSMQGLALLDVLQNIEKQHGRIRAEHWGARTLDLDIIAMDADVMDSEDLILPHQHMQDRQFVLRPLCDLAPKWQHPRLGKSAEQLLQGLIAAGEPALPKGILW